MPQIVTLVFYLLIYYLKKLADRYVYLKDEKINKIISRQEMNEMSNSHREKMELRLLDLNELDFALGNKKECNQEGIKIKDFIYKSRK